MHDFLNGLVKIELRCNLIVCIYWCNKEMMESREELSQKLRIGVCLGALGVVFGDVGTSPLYTMKVCLAALPVEYRQDGVLGILSLIFWSLVLVVCVKYIGGVLRADNKGQGGIFSLFSLGGLKEKMFRTKGGLCGGAFFVLFAASLLFGESVITPSITMLAAVEGLYGADIGLTQDYVIWIAAGILILLFSWQRLGISKFSKIFGFLLFLWFLLIGGLGAWHIIHYPQVLLAINPVYAIKLLVSGALSGYAIMLLGAVVLAITGVEALYAGMGHFGRRAISKSWYYCVMPGLLLNYFGQGAHVLKAHDFNNPFFELLPPGWPQGILALVAIMAAIIASQAVISGVFSTCLSAIQMGYFPRLKIFHTNDYEHDEIYIPAVCFTLAFFSVLVTIYFKTSSNLAAAYGVAVTGTMVITTFAFFFVLVNRWHWPKWKALLLCGAFWLIDWALFISTLHKFMDGGWLPVALGAFVFIIMHTWKSGSMSVKAFIESSALVDVNPLQVAEDSNLLRVKGGAIFMASSSRGVPIVLAHYLKVNKCLHEKVVILSIITDESPYVSDEKRMNVEEIGGGMWRVTVAYGYKENPTLPGLFSKFVEKGIPLEEVDTTFYFNREVIVTGGKSNLFDWQKRFYDFLSRNARPVKDYYQLTPSQVIEIGLPVQI